MELPFTIHNWWYLILSAVGLISLIMTLRSRRQANASQGWSGVQGKVIESRLEARQTTNYDGPDTTSYAAVIRYTYSVMGQEYTGDRVAFGAEPSNRAQVQALLERYPQDHSVMVYYDPGKPAQAVLEQASHSNWVQIAIAIALIVAGFVLAIR